MSYTVTLSSGKVFTGLRYAGTCFASPVEVKESDFAGGLQRVKIAAVGEEDSGMVPYGGEIIGAELGRVFTVEGEWYFYFEVMSPEELARLQDRADIDYLLMMAEV